MRRLCELTGNDSLLSGKRFVCRTCDIDPDFIHYSLDEKSIRRFVDALNCLQGISISVDGSIEELKHQDYHGKCVHIRITDGFGTSITTKMDIGVHRHFELEQDEFCFDVCTDENMREKSYDDIVNRIEATFDDVLYLKRVADSKQRWLDNDIVEVSEGILSFFKKKCL